MLLSRLHLVNFKSEVLLKCRMKHSLLLFIFGKGNGDWLLRIVRGCSVASDSVRPHGLRPPKLLCPQDFPGEDMVG